MSTCTYMLGVLGTGCASPFQSSRHLLFPNPPLSHGFCWPRMTAPHRPIMLSFRVEPRESHRSHVIPGFTAGSRSPTLQTPDQLMPTPHLHRSFAPILLPEHPTTRYPSRGCVSGAGLGWGVTSVAGLNVMQAKSTRSRPTSGSPDGEDGDGYCSSAWA